MGLRSDQDRKYCAIVGYCRWKVIPVLSGKKAVDLVLTIDAREELFCGHADSIAIASGDSDFTPLALKIREHGKPILIFGHSFTPLALRSAATGFHCVGWFQQEPGGWEPQTNSPKGSVDRESSLDKRELLRSRMVELIREIAETHGKVTIDKLGAIINVRDPIFSPSRYGSGSLSARLKQLGGINLSPVEREDGSVKDYEVRLNEH
jgi:hypothetical protein